MIQSGAQTTLTLPVADESKLGDIIWVSSGDSHGWKIAPAASGTTETIRIADLPYPTGWLGITWNTQSGSGVHYWAGIASSKDGTHLAAIDQQGSGTGGYIYTSADSGMTWTQRASAQFWSAIAMSSDGTKLAATVELGGIYISSDSGVTWSNANNAGSLYWNSIASSADGTHLAATVGGSAAGNIYTSSNSGATWVQRATSQYWSGVTMSNDGTKLAAAANLAGDGTTSGQVYVSSDSGVTWTASGSGAQRWWSIAGSSDGTHLAASVLHGDIFTSTNSGVTWTDSASGSQLYWSVGMSGDGTLLLGAALGDHLYSSVDFGTTWVSDRLGSTKNWVAIASSYDGTAVAAPASGSYVSTGTPQNTTTPTTGYLIGNGYSSIELQYVGSGLFNIIYSDGRFTPY